VLTDRQAGEKEKRKSGDKMFDASILKKHEFHDSIIENVVWSPNTKNFFLNGEFTEWERADNSGCSYYHFVFSGVEKLSMDDKNYQESSMIEIRVIPSGSGYYVTIIAEADFGNFALIEFFCTNIRHYFYKYKGMSYRNIYYDLQYQLIFEKMRAAYQEENFLKTEYKDLEDGYAVKADSYGRKNGTGNYAGYERLFIQKCCLMYQNEKIFEYESIYNMPSVTAKIIKHQNGRKYFLFKSDLYGLNVYNIEDKSVFYYLPEGYQHHYQQLCGESFIITDIHYDSETNRIAYEGCYWGGTNDVMAGDFSNPMNFAPRLVSMHEIVDPEYELYGDIDFSKWENGELYLSADCQTEKKIDVWKWVCIS